MVYDPWILGGDFNIILYDSEKKGGSPTSMGACNFFQSWFHLIACMIFNFTGPVLLDLVEAFSNALIVSFAVVSGLAIFQIQLCFILRN